VLEDKDMATLEEDPVIGTPAVAVLCGTTTKTIRDWLRRQAFPAPMRALPRGRLRWRRSTVEAWLANSSVRRCEEVGHGL
jgi:predicted DNA-binding transcriptional regulator AlpA